MKIQLLAIVLLFYCPFFHAQSWEAVGDSLSADAQGASPDATALGVYQDQLYVGGRFDRVGDSVAKAIAVWKDSAYVEFHQTSNIMGSTFVEEFIEYEGSWLVGGGFSDLMLNGVSSCAEWSNDQLSGSTYSMNSSVHALWVDTSGLYIGGFFDSTSSAQGIIFDRPYDKVVRYDGNAFQKMNGLGRIGTVYGLTAFQGDIIAGGFLIDGGPGVSRWDGSKWEALGGGVKGTVFDLAVYKEKLYAVGDFSEAGISGAFGIAVWDGITWSSVGSGLAGIDSKGLCLLADSLLYVGGNFVTAGGVASPNVAAWDGNTWSGVGTGLNEIVADLAVYQEALYAATFAGSGPNYLRRFDLNNTTSARLLPEIAVELYPNPVRDVLHIQVDEEGSWEYEVLDISGKQLLGGTFSRSMEGRIDFSAIRPGMYILQIKDRKTGNSVLKKILK